MTDATSAQPTPSPFTMVGDPAAAVCIGDVCVIPDHHEQAEVNRQLDADLV